jgi:enterochelin esterase-like enzyme
VELRLADPERRYAAVRLCSDLRLGDAERSYRRADGGWVLRLAPPPVARLEYQLELIDADGRSERACDPDNPHRAPGAFGEKSVLLLNGYAPPDWLHAAAVPGRLRALAVRGRGLGADVQARLWSPTDARPRERLPLLVAHDGPEYDALASLTRYAAAGIASGALPRHRVALLAPGERDEWYSASAVYARVLCTAVLPALRSAVAVGGPVVGMGASLGGLAMLHADRRHPGAFGALFLQSASFFLPRFDAHESNFPRYGRIVRFVRSTLRTGPAREQVPIAMTCGRAEENVHNNRLMARALGADLAEVPDLHNYTAWRDALDPYLTELLRGVWARCWA